MRSTTHPKKQMKLLTKDIKRRLPPLYSTEDQTADAKTFVCKFFDPCGSWTWYVVEGEEQPDGDWLFFGLVAGFEKEWGYFRLSELEGVRGSHGFSLGIERDIHFKNEPSYRYA